MILEVIWTIKDIVGLSLLGIIICGWLIYLLYLLIMIPIHKLFHKNCYECKHWCLSNVVSCGDGCWYKCDKCKFESPRLGMNNRYYWKRCKQFEHK